MQQQHRSMKSSFAQQWLREEDCRLQGKDSMHADATTFCVLIELV